MKKKIISIVVVLIMALMPVGVFGTDQENIAEIAIANGNFTTLVAALQKADLVEAVSGEGPLTVFAPTDEAFNKLLTQLNITANDLLNHPQLKEVLLFHVVSGKVMSTDLTNGMKVPTLNGEELTVDLTNGVKINGSTVTTADIEACNGVIHVIDTVLVPSNFTLASTGPVSPRADSSSGTSGRSTGTTATTATSTPVVLAEQEIPLAEDPVVTPVILDETTPLADVVPQTRDEGNIWLLLGLMLGSATGITALGKRRKTE